MSDPHRCPVGHAFNRAQHRECPTCASFLSTTLTTQANSATEVRWHDRELGDDVCAGLRERFDVIREVARGGMGKILLARETSTRRAVAIKVALSDVTTDLEQFLREAILTSRFEHPGILPVFDVGVVSGHPYYSMRWIEGRALSRIWGNLTLRQKLQALRDAAQAVAYVHNQGLWHRDLKPQNILLGSWQDAYVIDWGLISVQPGRVYQHAPAEVGVGDSTIRVAPVHRWSPPSLTSDSPLLASLSEDTPLLGEDRLSLTLMRQGMQVGTPLYMAPEQWAGDEATMGAHCDVWAFGIMLFQALTGQHPFVQRARSLSEVMDEVTSDRPVQLGAFEPRIPSVLRELVHLLLIKEHAKRPSSLAEFITGLNAVLEPEMFIKAAEQRWRDEKAKMTEVRDWLWRKCDLHDELLSLNLFEFRRARDIRTELVMISEWLETNAPHFRTTPRSKQNVENQWRRFRDRKRQ